MGAKRGLTKLFFEFASIVVAVLLALFLTEARQNYLDKRKAKNSFEAIQREVADNLELIWLDSVSHLEKLDQVNRWLEAPAEIRDTIYVHFEIIHSLTKSTAWEVAKLNQVVHHMPDTLVMAISRVYTMQDFYDKNGRDMYGQMTGIIRDVNDKEKMEGAMVAYGYELVKEATSVSTLKQTYQEFLKDYPYQTASPSDSTDQ